MLVRLNHEHPQQKDIAKIIDCLKNDGIIIYPTDTVYSMGCDIMNQKPSKNYVSSKTLNQKKPIFLSFAVI